MHNMQNNMLDNMYQICKKESTICTICMLFYMHNRHNIMQNNMQTICICKICKTCIIDSMLKMQNNIQLNMQPICKLIHKLCIICKRNQNAKYDK